MQKKSGRPWLYISKYQKAKYEYKIKHTHHRKKMWQLIMHEYDSKKRSKKIAECPPKKTQNIID